MTEQREFLFSEIQLWFPHLKSSLLAGVPQDVTPCVSKTSARDLRTKHNGGQWQTWTTTLEREEWGWVRGMVSHSLPCQLSDQDTWVWRDTVWGRASVCLMHI